VLARCHYLHQLPHEDVQVAGAIYRACRRAGETVRRANDCLIAAIAIRHDLPLLHRDRDFDAIARHTRLRIVE
jgi:predicted nucleic acid-binding protein